MLPNTLLIIDTETTGLKAQSSCVIELGAILYSVSHRCVLQQVSTLLPIVGQNPVEYINHISAEVSRSSYQYQPVLKIFQQWHDHADYLVAHNAEFDKKWFGKGLLPSVNKPWICTYDDFLWEQASQQHLSLINLALEYNISFNQAHRALTDCQIIVELFNESCDFDKMLIQAIERSQEPQYYVIANVSRNNRNLAKKRGFRWNQYLPNKWVKKMRMSDYQREQAISPYLFEVSIVPLSGSL